MPNPYHDENGKFCSRDGMLESGERILESKGYSAYSEFREYFDVIDGAEKKRSEYKAFTGLALEDDPDYVEVPAVNPHRIFRQATAVHSWDCSCSTCESGTTVNSRNWEEKANLHDVIDMISPESSETYEDGRKKFDMLFESSFSDYNVVDYVDHVKDKIMNEYRSGSSSIVNAASGRPRISDSYVAVDPVGCGCTECLIGEYIPYDRWREEGGIGDVAAVFNGNISNHSNYSDFNFAFNSPRFDPEINQFIEGVKDNCFTELTVDLRWEARRYLGQSF
jgi:hypothetical protein